MLHLIQRIELWEVNAWLKILIYLAYSKGEVISQGRLLKYSSAQS